MIYLVKLSRVLSIVYFKNMNPPEKGWNKTKIVSWTLNKIKGELSVSRIEQSEHISMGDTVNRVEIGKR